MTLAPVTMKAVGSSPAPRSGRPTTAASFTAGWASNRLSNSAGATLKGTKRQHIVVK